MEKHIVISNPEKFEELRKSFIEGGFENLHILADFDRTVTYGLDKTGKKTPTVISKLRTNSEYLGQKYFDEAHRLFDVYHPIEIDASISLDEKKDKMYEWWSEHFGLIARSGLDKDLINKVAAENPLEFREGVLEFMRLLHKKKVPVVFISAGPGDMIETFLEKDKLDFSNIYVIGNRYVFDDNGNVVAIKEPIVHTFNKTEVVLRGMDIYDKIKNKKNVLLLGDQIGDAGMIEGFDCDNLLKVGFLNENVEDSLEEYKKNFDVVLTGDCDFTYVNNFLKELK
jgi:cytosolic 5'-nucleotidase 3